jgi:hypothetical protein
VLVNISLEHTSEVHSDHLFIAAAVNSDRHVRSRHKLIVVLYLVSAPVVSVAWLAALMWAAIKMVGYALS